MRCAVCVLFCLSLLGLWSKCGWMMHGLILFCRVRAFRSRWRSVTGFVIMQVFKAYF